MNNILRLIPVLLMPLLLGSCNVLSAPLPTNEAARLTSKEEAPSQPIESVDTAGLTAWLAPNHTLPLVSVQLVFEGAGSSSEPQGKEGRAMFAAALMDEGAGDLSALQFQQALEEKAIQLSLTTSEDVLVVQLSCLTEHMDAAFQLLNLALTKAQFSPTDVERKRAEALSLLRDATNRPAYVLSKEFSAAAFAGHPYSAPPLGTAASLMSMSRADLAAYARTHLTKDRVFIAAAGDITAAQLQQALQTHLAALPATSPVPSPSDITLQQKNTRKVVDLAIPQTHILLAATAPNRRDEHFLAAYILNHIIGGNTLYSVLGKSIREKQGLAYNVNSYLDPMSHSSLFKVALATSNDQAQAAYHTLTEELSQLASSGVSDEQFNDALDYITGSFVLSLDSNAAYTHYLNIMQRFDLGKDYLHTRNQQMRAVTKAQVNALAKEWLKPENWLVVMVGQPQGVSSGPVEEQKTAQ